MNTLKRCGCAVVIFMAGGNTFLNLSHMKYGYPTHFEGSWRKIIVSCAIAMLWTILMIRQQGE